MSDETFRTRFGLLTALLGMAVGTGNIWRFPRVMAANGGGAFLIPWLLFLFLWSVPLLIIEFSLGQKLRKGVAGCFHDLTRGRYTWLGAFVVLCTLGIMFYYSVVTGWCVYYLVQAVTGKLLSVDSRVFWDSFTRASYAPLIFHLLALGMTTAVVARGVRRGIESVSMIMIPLLFVILIGLSLYAFFLPGRTQALRFIFDPDFSRLGDYRVWLEALTQSAWSTGAGWGIALSYACYARKSDDPVLTPFTTGFGNNSVELFAALAIMPTLFSFFPLAEVVDLTESGNTGLTFIALPGLFQQMPGGRIVAILFFIALFFAAFTSLVSMFELGVRFFHDLGFSRKFAILCVAGAGLLIGAPSALRIDFLNNQDWVWGVGLLLSGFFFALLMRRVGIGVFCHQFLPLKWEVNRAVFEIIVFWVIPIEFLILIGWWFSQAVGWAPKGWWNPFSIYSVGTCLVQWGLLLAVLRFLNGYLGNRIRSSGS